MKKSFTIGAVSGITALSVAFPLVAQFAGAQEATSAESSSTSGDHAFFHERAPLTQEDVQKMVDRDNALLLHVDGFVSVLKEATQNHRIALEAAADISDEAERNDAVKAANEAMRASMQAYVEANPDIQPGMLPFGKGGHHRPGMKMMKGHMENKLGLTPEEVRAKIESGMTIEEIAEEQGVTLPERPAFGRRPMDEEEQD